MFKKLIALITMYINARLDNDTATANVLARFIDIELLENISTNEDKASQENTKEKENDSNTFKTTVLL